MGVKYSQLPVATDVAANDQIAMLDVSGEVLTRIPVAHASTADAFGKGNSTQFGHVKVSDVYSSTVGGAADGVAASQSALKAVYDLASQPSTDVPLSVVDGKICVTYTTD